MNKLLFSLGHYAKHTALCMFFFLSFEMDLSAFSTNGCLLLVYHRYGSASKCQTVPSYIFVVNVANDLSWSNICSVLFVSCPAIQVTGRVECQY